MTSEIYLPVADIHIQMKSRRTYPYDEVDSFIGFDCETYKGACKLLCNSFGNYLLNGTFYEYLDFLCEPKDDISHRIFWNIDFDFGAILKLYKGKRERLEKLLDGYVVQFKGFEILYLRPKFLSIKKDKKSFIFTDMYFMYKKSLNYASKEFLKDKKIDTIDGNSLNTDLSYWKKNLDDIIKYCIKDCVLTKELGKFLIENVKLAGLPIPRILSSHASFSKQYFMSIAKIPSIKWIPENILDIACKTYYGGRFELLERGYFEKLISYDINSAYPDTISKLPSLKYGKWIKVKEGTKKEVKGKIILGFYKVRMIIPQTFISPFIIKYKGTCCNPSGIFETWITWYEFDLLREYIIDFYYGYEYIPSKREYYPFKEGIDVLYHQKATQKPKYDKKGNQISGNAVLYWIFKIFMNALYGCFIERHDDKVLDITVAGKMFNSVYASIITARTRWKLLKDVKKKHWKYLKGFHTDSIITTKKLRELKLNSKLGNWSKEKEGKGLLLMCGIYQIGREAKNRGFSTKKIISLKDNDFGTSLNWFEIMEIFAKKKVCDEIHIEKVFNEKTKRYHNKKVVCDTLFENSNKCPKCKSENVRYVDFIRFEKIKVLKVKETLKRWHNLEKVNTFTPLEKNLSLNSDKKRDWNRLFDNCNDVLTSTIKSKTVKMKYFLDVDLE